MYFNPPKEFPINELWENLSHRELSPNKRKWLIKIVYRSCGIGDDYNKRIKYCSRFCHNDFDRNFVSYLQGIIESKLFRLNQERMKYADATGKTIRLYRTCHCPINIDGIYHAKGSIDTENNIYVGSGDRVELPGRPRNNESKESYNLRHSDFSDCKSFFNSKNTCAKIAQTQKSEKNVDSLLKQLVDGFRPSYGTNSKLTIEPDFDLNDAESTRGEFYNEIRNMFSRDHLTAASKNIRANHTYKTIDSDWLINYLRRGQEKFNNK